MPAPHPLSRGFDDYIEGLEQKIEQLTRSFDLAMADLGALSDRLGSAEKVSGQSPVILPARVTGGTESTVSVAFDGDFAISQYKGGEPQEWMEFIPATIAGIPNVINNPAAPPQGQRLHGVTVGNVEGAVVDTLEFFSSGVLVVFYLPFVAAPAFAHEVDAEFPEGAVHCVVYAKPDLAVACA